MAKAILICGRICSGKSTLARRLCRERNAVALSLDEVMLTLFEEGCGDQHEMYAARTKRYLYRKAFEIIGAGVDVVLDWGFWRAGDRAEAERCFKERGIACEKHYICLPDRTQLRYIEKRNAEVRNGTAEAYLVDEGLYRKAASLFEEPAADWADVRHEPDEGSESVKCLHR